MRKIITSAVVLSLAAVPLVATPAAADASSCTHHFSGPQICIRLEGKNAWNSVTGFWTNPPAHLKKRKVHLYLDGKHFNTSTARRVGDTLSYTWSNFQTGTDKKICVRFKGSERMACETTKYSGI